MCGGGGGGGERWPRRARPPRRRGAGRRRRVPRRARPPRRVRRGPPRRAHRLDGHHVEHGERRGAGPAPPPPPWRVRRGAGAGHRLDGREPPSTARPTASAPRSWPSSATASSTARSWRRPPRARRPPRGAGHRVEHGERRGAGHRGLDGHHVDGEPLATAGHRVEHGHRRGAGPRVEHVEATRRRRGAHRLRRPPAHYLDERAAEERGNEAAEPSTIDGCTQLALAGGAFLARPAASPNDTTDADLDRRVRRFRRRATGSMCIALCASRPAMSRDASASSATAPGPRSRSTGSRCCATAASPTG
jgi:hypothetical protein